MMCVVMGVDDGNSRQRAPMSIDFAPPQTKIGGKLVGGGGRLRHRARARCRKPVSLTMRDVCAQALHQQQALVL